MTATIDPLHPKGDKSWGAKAAAGDALSRVPNDAPFIGIWIDKNEKGEDVVKWSKANTSFQQYSYIALVLMEFAQSCVRQAMDRDK